MEGTRTTMLTDAPPPPPSAASKQLLPWLVAVAFFMESLDTTILNTAVPVVSEAGDGQSSPGIRNDFWPPMPSSSSRSWWPPYGVPIRVATSRDAHRRCPDRKSRST